MAVMKTSVLLRQEDVNTVKVAAGIRRALDLLSTADLNELMTTFISEHKVTLTNKR